MSKKSLSTKIILIVEGIVLFSSILFCTISIYRARIGIRKAIQQRMLDIANCASGSVNGDVLKSLTKADTGSDEYNNIYNTLAVFRDNVELEYVYCIRQTEDGQFIFTMDLDLYTPAGFGDSVKYTEALARAGRGTAAVDEVPYSDAWGKFYSAYSPVFDSSGAVAGIIAVDFSAEWFEAQLSAQTLSTVVSYVAVLLLSLAVAAVLSMMTVRPFVKMQARLLEEKVRAESSSRAKSDFLANMSHEIRTPINAVLGMNEMILREDHQAQSHAGDSAPPVREALENIGVYAENVKNAGHNLLAIINDILDFSRIEAGRLELQETTYQLSSVLNDLSNMFYFRAQDKALTFVIDADESLPDHLRGDEVRIRQVLTNILSNAVKYTEHGSIRLTVRGEKQGDGRINLTFTVEDTGIGIRPEDMEKLFARFERLDMRRNSTVEGTGLGLVITKLLLDMMGGSISVNSTYGVGSVFTVVIPQGIADDAPMGDYEKRFEASVKEAAPYREAFRAPEARILIVDDTQMNLNVVINLLKKTEIQIDTATSGADALALTDRNPYDAILMDQRMPGMNGTETMHQIRGRAESLNRETPVICLTADAVVGARERYLSDGFADYLSKPVSGQMLEQVILKYLPDRKVQRVQNGEPPADVSATVYSAAGNNDYAPLRAAGIDPGIGMGYCQGDEELYRSLLQDYLQCSGERAEGLASRYDERDWKAYAILAHTVKSSSKTIGATALSEIAAKLEAAADAGDLAILQRDHQRLLEQYNMTVAAIRSIIPLSEEKHNEEEILEFMPE